MIFSRFLTDKKIAIFYHLYAINQWKALFLSHLDKMIQAGMYSSCESVFIGINYEHERDLEVFQQSFCSKYDKLEILFARRIDTSSNPKQYKLPYKSKNGKEYFSFIELGESETILAMANYCQNKKNRICFFLHSKGVTGPGLRSGQIKQFRKIAKCIDLLLPDTNINELADAIVHELILRYIANWRRSIECSEQDDYHYLIWNIFSADSRFISKFKWKRWFSEETIERYTNQKLSSLTDRHAFAGFPIKLYSQTSEKNIKAISEYFNFPTSINLSKTNPSSSIRKHQRFFKST